MINATQLRKGMIIKLEGELYRVVEAVHIAPGNWKACVQTKLRHLKNQNLIDYRFRSEDRVEQAILEEVPMEFLYRDGSDFVFMNLETFEQLSLNEELIGDAINYLVPNVVFTIEMHEGKPVGVKPPLTVDLKVIKTEPYLKGATQSASGKPATLETGLTVTVPQFIREGDIVRIDTREDKYVERVKTA
jgi:elongation factor P